MTVVNTIPVDGELHLRAKLPAEFGHYWELIERNRAHLATWFPWAETATYESVCAFTTDQIERHTKGIDACYGIWSGAQLVGAIDLRGLHAPLEANIGYYLGQFEQGRGIMTAAVRALAETGFASFDLHRIEIVAALANRRSRLVAERAGFRFEGIARERTIARGARHDAAVYARLATDEHP